MHTIVASILVDLKEKESERGLRPDSVCNQELKKMQLGRELLTVTKKKAPNAICVSRYLTVRPCLVEALDRLAVFLKNFKRERKNVKKKCPDYADCVSRHSTVRPCLY